MHPTLNALPYSRFQKCLCETSFLLIAQADCSPLLAQSLRCSKFGVKILVLRNRQESALAAYLMLALRCESPANIPEARNVAVSFLCHCGLCQAYHPRRLVPHLPHVQVDPLIPHPPPPLFILAILGRPILQIIRTSPPKHFRHPVPSEPRLLGHVDGIARP